MTIPIFLGLLLVLVVLALVLRPLFTARTERRALLEDDEQLENLLFEREAVLSALRDIRFDREMGKLNEEDFSTLETRYRAHAVEVLKRLDQLGDGEQLDDDEALDAWIEAEVQTRRSAAEEPDEEPSGGRCPECGHPLEADDRFCSNCGTPVSADVRA